MGYDEIDWDEYDYFEEDEEMAVLGDVNWELVDNDDSFKEHAICKGMPAEVFFLNQSDNFKGKLPIVRELCGRCPVNADCLRFALNNNIQYGIWAGTSPSQRKRLRQQMRLDNE